MLSVLKDQEHFCQLMFQDPSVFTRLELPQRHNFNNETIKNDLKFNELTLTMLISKCKRL